MKKLPTEHQRAVSEVKARISPKTPCVRADADGYCTGPCEGSLCFKCGDDKPVTVVAEATHEAVSVDKVTALNVRVDDLQMPEGSPAEQANYLHVEFLRNAVSAKMRAVQCGWVLAAQRERLGNGQWLNWVAESLNFSQRTAYNYIVAYQSTVGAYRARQRRPLPLSAEPTVDEITAATANAKEKPLASLYRGTKVFDNNPKHGGDRREKAAENGHVVGRPKKNPDAPLAESDVDGELCAEEGRDLLSKLAGWALGADDGFGTLPDRELANAVETLEKMLKRAKDIRDAREAGR